MTRSTTNPLPLDAAARDELARKAEEVIELRLLYKGAPNNGFSQFDVRAALDHAEEALDAAGSPDVILALLASVRGAEAETEALADAMMRADLYHCGVGQWSCRTANGEVYSDSPLAAFRAARAHPPTKEPADAE